MVSSLGIKWPTMDTEQLFNFSRYTTYADEGRVCVVITNQMPVHHFTAVYTHLVHTEHAQCDVYIP